MAIFDLTIMMVDPTAHAFRDDLIALMDYLVTSMLRVNLITQFNGYSHSPTVDTTCTADYMVSNSLQC